MVRKCGYCDRDGCSIRTCNNPVGVELVENIKFKCYIALQNNTNVVFTQLLRHIASLQIKDLRLLLAKQSVRTQGNKNILYSKVVFYYYYTDAYNLLYPEQDLNNRFHAEMIQERNYWLNRGRGLSDVQARGLVIRQPQYLEIHPEVKHHFQVIFDISDDNEYPIEVDCPICLDTIKSSANLVKTCCNHSFCSNCIKTHVESSNKCPCCRSTINNLYVSNI